MLKIRPHHLNCMPWFIGKGYSDDFCENMQKIKARIENGEPYTLVYEADDICALCPNLINGVCKDNDKVLRYDRLSVDETDISKICPDCQWYEICSRFQ